MAMMATPTRTLIRQTERAIKLYMKEDCETNLPLIKTLEDISYQLWIESNTTFLDESTCSTYTDDEGWQWDEDCFHESYPTTLTGTDGTIIDRGSWFESSGSSICSSIRPCDETDCSIGYLASAELDKTEVDSMEVCQGTTCENVDTCDDWVIISDDSLSEEIDENDWLVLSTVLNDNNSAQTCSSFMKSCNRSSDKSRYSSSANSDIKTSSDTVSSDNDTDTEDDHGDDWTVLSMKVSEIGHNTGLDLLDQSRDSGIRSMNAVCATSPFGYVHSAPNVDLRNHLCLGKLLRSLIHFQPDSQKGHSDCCCCCCKLQDREFLEGIIEEILNR